MTTTDAKRKLAAILSADAKGYSRLMEGDEEATVTTLTAYRQVMTDVIEKHRGRLVDSPGDNLLAEFVSVVDAMRGAVEIQEELRARNSELPDHRRMEFRVGINLGDVIEEEGRLYGDGVNIAARIEGLADGGGICLSESAYQQVKNKLSLGIEYLGEHEVKNISEPVPVYRLVMGPEARPRRAKGRKARQTGWKWATLAAMAVLVLVFAAGALRKLAFRVSPPPFEPASAERMAFPLPEKPSIAVLPFDNMSGDPNQEYLSDGITEDLITDLSKISDLFVIARNSVFTYKGRPVKIAQVSEELGVRYVLEGSVRRADDRVRITAQLVDASTGYHLWSERYDRQMEDVFDLQDEVREKIVAALAVQLTEDERVRLTRRKTENLKAFDYYLRGSEYLNRFTEHENVRARQMFQKAVALDPEYASAYTRLALTHLHEWNFGWSRDPQSLERAFKSAQKATALDESVPEAHRILGRVYLWKKQHETAIAEAEKAIALDPNDAHGYAGLGDILTWAGRSEEGLGLVTKAMRLNPMYPVWYLLNLGHAYYWTEQYQKAAETLKRALDLHPDFLPARIYLVAAYSELGHHDQAKVEVETLLTENPWVSAEGFSQKIPYKDPNMLEHLFEVLRNAGVP